MIEYLYDAIRASSGEDITISAKAINEDGSCITSGCHLHLYDDESLIALIDGEIVDEIWEFTIPAEQTKGMKGRFWYAICGGEGTLNFRQPIYLV